MTPLRWLYTALIGVAVAFAIAWIVWSGSWVGNLAPNAITEALSILVTVAVVNRLIERREETRRSPRATAALNSVSDAFHRLIAMIGGDYTQTHIGNYEEPPHGIDALLDFRLAHFEDEDEPRRVVDGRLPLADAVRTLMSDLEVAWRNDDEFLDPGYVVAIRELTGGLEFIVEFHEFTRRHAPDDPDVRAEHLRGVAVDIVNEVIEQAREFLPTYRKQPGAELTLAGFAKGQLKGARIMAKRVLYERADKDAGGNA